MCLLRTYPKNTAFLHFSALGFVAIQKLLPDLTPLQVYSSTPSVRDLEPPVTTRQELKIPLKREQVEIKKETYIKEEVVVKKRRVLETKTITEEVSSEKLLVSGQDVSDVSEGK